MKFSRFKQFKKDLRNYAAKMTDKHFEQLIDRLLLGQNRCRVCGRRVAGSGGTFYRRQQNRRRRTGTYGVWPQSTGRPLHPCQSRRSIELLVACITFDGHSDIPHSTLVGRLLLFLGHLRLYRLLLDLFWLLYGYSRVGCRCTRCKAQTGCDDE